MTALFRRPGGPTETRPYRPGPAHGRSAPASDAEARAIAEAERDAERLVANADREAAWQEGYRAGVTAARDAADTAAAMLVAGLGPQWEAARRDWDARLAALAADAAALAEAAAAHIAGAALADDARQLQALATAIARVGERPALRLTVPAPLADRVAALLPQATVIADSAMAPGAFRLDWTGGGLDSDPAARRAAAARLLAAVIE